MAALSTTYDFKVQNDSAYATSELTVQISSQLEVVWTRNDQNQ